jgi:hypothetical protein
VAVFFLKGGIFAAGASVVTGLKNNERRLYKNEHATIRERGRPGAAATFFSL